MNDLYQDLGFPPAPPHRPYVFMNMVATIDGKTVSGTRNEPVEDLGSPNDHAAMRTIEHAADAVMIGAGTLRAIPRLWYPPEKWRFVVSNSGDVPAHGRFFTDAPDIAFVVTSISGAENIPEDCQCIAIGDPDIDWPGLLAVMRKEMGITRLLVEGGSELNASLLSIGLVDELFLTVAPKIKLGASLPTFAGGQPLPKGGLLEFDLVSNQTVGNEVFLRYRRSHK